MANKILFIILLLIILAFFAGRFLVVDQSPQKSDVIVVLSGGNGSRLERAAFLYQQGYAPRVIITGVCTGHTLSQISRLGVPAKDVILEPHARNTYENAVFSKELMKIYRFKSAIVVSSDYHMRRVNYAFDKEYRGSGITLIYCATRERDFDVNYWWVKSRSRNYVFSEYIKIIGYVLGWNNVRSMMEH